MSEDIETNPGPVGECLLVSIMDTMMLMEYRYIPSIVITTGL